MSEGYVIPDDAPMMGVIDYEYGIQYFSTYYNEWRMASTNHFEGWYPSKGSRNNALAQLRATRWGRQPDTEYRPVRRPVGEVEVME
jgi:hypothetical protein